MKYIKLFEIFNKYDYINIDELEKQYDYFHVSKLFLLNDDNKTFTFNKKIPFSPYKDDNSKIIEDNFTERISVSNSIKLCIESVDGDDLENLYIYGIKKENITTILNLTENFNNCPINYGIEFDLDNWLENLSKKDYIKIQKYIYNNVISDLKDLKDELKYTDIYIQDFIESPNDLPDEFKKNFYGCVPDCNITNEVWILDNNVTMDYLGEIDFDEIGDIYHGKHNKIRKLKI